MPKEFYPSTSTIHTRQHYIARHRIPWKSDEYLHNFTLPLVRYKTFIYTFLSPLRTFLYLYFYFIFILCFGYQMECKNAKSIHSS